VKIEQTHRVFAPARWFLERRSAQPVQGRKKPWFQWLRIFLRAQRLHRWCVEPRGI